MRQGIYSLDTGYFSIEILIVFMTPLKIAVVVHGRFHAFDLVRELIKQGNEVTLFTNYPKYIVERFGIPQIHVRSFLLHGIFSRIFQKLNQLLPIPSFEPLFLSLFSKWAARHISKESYDVVHCFSGIAEELFKSSPSNNKTLNVLVRGSAHITVQKQLLDQEEIRANSPVEIDKPSDWIIAREEREYQLADIIVVLSTFAQTSFIQQGIEPKKLRILPLGTQLSLFRPSTKIIADRCQRILSEQPLRVLMVGNFSLQKGAIDFVEIAKNAGSNFQFKFVGTITNDGHLLHETNNQYIDFVPKQPQSELPQAYAEADVFIFTTIQDGYAVVLSQAQAAGLPILATTNCSAPDFIVENETGWILPIRSPDTFIGRLNWCSEHRQELAEMVKRVYEDFEPRDWSNVAQDFTIIARDYLEQC
jgi:glycosyltransferase involved in cell wall biosynthesis